VGGGNPEVVREEEVKNVADARLFLNCKSQSGSDDQTPHNLPLSVVGFHVIQTGSATLQQARTKGPTMTTSKFNQSCSMPCRLEAEGKCLRQLLSESITHQAYLSHGQLSGLRTLYHPDPLPPCVTEHGLLHFHLLSAEEEAQQLETTRNEDSPGL
jgi:hypothetical protein